MEADKSGTGTIRSRVERAGRGRCARARWLAFAAALALAPAVAPAAGISCGSVYEVESGDSLSAIADRAYGDYRKWTLIYNANLDVIGDEPDLLTPGQRFRIPCLGSGDSGEALPGASDRATTLLSGGGYRPFTNRNREDGGLFPDLLRTALQDAEVSDEIIGDFGFAWEDDWAQHLDPLLSGGEHDLGFPWLKPDCAAQPDSYRCRNFRFSEPMFEMLVVLFVDPSDPVTFEKDSDLHGRVLCRPRGYYTHDLEKDGRNWLSERRVTLLEPDSIEECFRLLVEVGGVDAVAVNEFSGRAAVHRLGLQDRVEILQSRPLSIEGLHVVVHRDHPRSEAMIREVDAAMERLRADGRYQRIMDRHLSAYWARF